MDAEGLKDTRVPHSRLEDAVALVVGTLMVSFGVTLLQKVGALTGGMAGLSILLHHMTGIRFGVLFFFLNMPFYYLAWRTLGKVFVLKTFCAIALVSGFAELHPQFIQIAGLETFYATVIGSVIMGLGFIVLFRHRASLGGFNMLALYLQDRYGIRAGSVQLVLDLAILLASVVLVPVPVLIASVVGAVILNIMIAMNHRPYRYLA
ncbi:YitT family protein [Pararhodospirillum photometricum]|nr:YitT family protein [Pararhodospirillum photometricum]